MSASLYTPQSLGLLALDGTTTPIYNGDGSLRQVGSAQTLADIVVKNPGQSYQLVFYGANALIAGHDTSTPMPTNGLAPLVTWTISNPDAAASNRLQVVEISGSQQYTNIFSWNVSQQTWQLLSGNGLRQQAVGNTWSADRSVRTETRQTVDVATGLLVAKSVNTYKTYTWGEVLLSQVEGSGGTTSTNTYLNYGDLDQQIIQGRVYRHTDVNGQELEYDYDDAGRLVNSIYFGGHTAYDYASNPPAGFRDDLSWWPMQPRSTTISDNNSATIGQSYFVAQPNVGISIRAANATRLCTTNVYYPTGVENARRLQCTKYPDGTASIYSYNIGANGQTNTVLTGVPNGAYDNITDGTKQVTVLGTVGEVLLTQSFDISPAHPTGLLMQQDNYNYTDINKQSYVVVHLDGTTNVVQYACCGLDLTVDRDGVITQFYYDALKRQVASTIVNFGITTSNILDVAGNVIAKVTIAGGNCVTNWSGAYDSLGRLATEINALGGVTTYSYGFDMSGNPTNAVSYPDAGKRFEISNPDMTPSIIGGTATFGLSYSYLSSPYGGKAEKVVKLDNTGRATQEFTETD